MQQYTKKSMKYLSIFMCLGLLAACSNEQDDLRAWIEQVKTKAVPISPELDPLKEYIVQPYMSANLLSPFSSNRIGKAQLETPPDGARAREPLEMVGLETMRYIGLMKSPAQKKQSPQVRAMVLVDGKVYSVKYGQYLGQDYGKIIGINDDEIRLRELVKDGSNEWKEKLTTLPLQAGGSNNNEQTNQ